MNKYVVGIGIPKNNNIIRASYAYARPLSFVACMAIASYEEIPGDSDLSNF